MKLFSTSNLNIPTTLKMTIKNVDPKIKTLLFLVKEPNRDVIKDFSVSLISISFLEENKLNKDGNNKNVTNNETINPKVIINPKSIIGLMSLKTKDKKEAEKLLFDWKNELLYSDSLNDSNEKLDMDVKDKPKVDNTRRKALMITSSLMGAVTPSNLR